MLTSFLIGSLIIVMLIVPWMTTRTMVELDASIHDGDAQPAATSLFTSNRERKLWLYLLVVMVAIYSTLGPAQMLVEVFEGNIFLQEVSGTVLLLISVVGIAFWIKSKPGWREIGVVLGVLVVYVLTLVRVVNPWERSHVFEYGLVAILVFQALSERTRDRNLVLMPALVALVITSFLGWIDEGIQYVLPNRVYDIEDVMFNAIAGLMAISSSVILILAKRLDLKQRFGRSGD